MIKNKLTIGIIIGLFMIAGAIAGGIILSTISVDVEKSCYDIIKTKNISYGKTICSGDTCKFDILVDGVVKDTLGLEKVKDFEKSSLTAQRDEVINYYTKEKLCAEYSKVPDTKSELIEEGNLVIKEKKK